MVRRCTSSGVEEPHRPAPAPQLRQGSVGSQAYRTEDLHRAVEHSGLQLGKHRYTVIHSVLAVPHRAAAFVDKETVRKFYEEDAEAIFKPIRAFFAQQGINATFVHTVGHAADWIANLAEEGTFDLLALGSRGRGDLANLVLGSVATKVLASARYRCCSCADA